MVYNTTQHPPPHSHTLTVRLLWEGGGGEVREKVVGQQCKRGVENNNMTDGITSL